MGELCLTHDGARANQLPRQDNGLTASHGIQALQPPRVPCARHGARREWVCRHQLRRVLAPCRHPQSLQGERGTWDTSSIHMSSIYHAYIHQAYIRHIYLSEDPQQNRRLPGPSKGIFQSMSAVSLKQLMISATPTVDSALHTAKTHGL